MKRVKSEHIKIGIHCLLIALGLLCVFRFVKVKYIDEVKDGFSGRYVTAQNIDQKKYTVTEKKGELTQQFQVTTDILWGIQLSFRGSWEDKTKSVIQIMVIDDNEGIVLDQVLSLKEIGSEQPLQIIFDHIEQETKGREFTIKIIPQKIDERDTVQVVLVKEGNDQDLLQDHTGEIRGGLLLRQMDRQNHYLSKWFWAIAIGISGLIYLLYFFVFVKKSRLEFIFLFVMLVVGTIMIFLLKPGAVPDESAHYRSAYAWSNVVMGESREVYAPIKMRKDDSQMHQTLKSTKLTVDAYTDLKEQFLRPAVDKESTTIEQYPTRSPGFLYLGEITGITIGRILGFNGLTVFYLGRMFGLLLFVGMAFYAMCKIPFYKMSIAAICLFPMSVQMAAGYSYDSTILGLALMAIAIILSLAASDHKKNMKWDFIKLAVIFILLGSCKGGAYLPLCGMLLLIPKERYTSKKKRWIYVGITVVGAIACLMMSSAGVVSSSVGVSTHLVEWAQEPGYTISWIFENPGDFIQLITNTIFTNVGEYVNSLVGKDLGWFNVPIQTGVVYGFIATFLISSVHVTEERSAIMLNKRQRAGTMICIVVSVAIIAAAMMLSWTPQSYKTIQGIQGRYFLPLLLPLVLCMKNNILTLKKRYDRELMFAIAWLLLLTMVCIMEVPLGQMIR